MRNNSEAIELRFMARNAFFKGFFHQVVLNIKIESTLLQDRLQDHKFWMRANPDTNQ